MLLLTQNRRFHYTNSIFKRHIGFKLPIELLVKDGSRNLCSNVVSDRVRGYFMTHCALIALL